MISLVEESCLVVSSLEEPRFQQVLNCRSSRDQWCELVSSLDSKQICVRWSNAVRNETEGSADV
jgi:hypothetical protein